MSLHVLCYQNSLALLAGAFVNLLFFTQFFFCFQVDNCDSVIFLFHSHSGVQKISFYFFQAV